MSLFERDLAIDLGTANVRIAARGKGVILREPSVVAMDKNTGRLLRYGMEAQKMLGRTPANIVAIDPMKAGAISDYEMTERMLREMVKSVTSFSLLKPRMLIGIPSGISEVEERAVIDAGMEAGARKVYLMETPLAAALGAGLDLSGADGKMLVDVGGGTTDVAVLSLNGVVESDSVKVAGDAFNEALIRYVRRKYNLMIGDATAEELKRQICCIFPREDVAAVEVKGRCLMTGLPRTIELNSNETLEALEETGERIVEAVIRVLESTPPELIADITTNGIVMTGGGSCLWGFDRLLETRTEIPVRIADDPDMCVAFGLAKALEWLDDMNEGTLNLNRRRQLKQ
ncbi:MAG: rod shape-determining protein [Oscillospiraceae bacterium]|nr:rod shape-determining protein [Oscillospiraceae bacterium]